MKQLTIEEQEHWFFFLYKWKPGNETQILQAPGIPHFFIINLN